MIGLPVYCLLAAAASYFATYPEECREAIDFFKTHKSEFINETHSLTAEERKMAAAIVAPEVSQYSSIMNFFEFNSLYVTYIYQGSGDFSIGIFQMKPSFAETIEQRIVSDKRLRRDYTTWVKEFSVKDTELETRRARLKRLEDHRWQMRYLTMFMRLASRRMEQLKFSNNLDRLRYLATLYNSGLDSSPARVARKQKQHYFPHHNPRFNYADITVEFYCRMP